MPYYRLTASLWITSLLWVTALGGAEAPYAVEPSAGPPPTRLKDLVTLEGVRDNQLIGYGLVVGLAGTGDRQQTVFPTQS
jgi:flagellar P-ring protein precursor FlgI